MKQISSLETVKDELQLLPMLFEGRGDDNEIFEIETCKSEVDRRWEVDGQRPKGSLKPKIPFLVTDILHDLMDNKRMYKRNNCTRC